MSNDKHQYNISVLSQMFGLHRDTLRKRLNEAGVESCGRKGNAPLYHAHEAAQAVFASQSISVDRLDPDRMDPKERLDWYKSETERLRYQTTTKELTPSEEVRDVQSSLLKRVAAWFDDLPTKAERTAIFNADQLIQLERFADEMRVSLHDEIVVGGYSD